MGRGGKDWEFGISRCKLIYTEWIINKVLLCSTGNYIQYPVINCNGKEYEKVCICIIGSLCCTSEVNEHCKSTTSFNKVFFKKKEKKKPMFLLSICFSTLCSLHILS